MDLSPDRPPWQLRSWLKRQPNPELNRQCLLPPQILQRVSPPRNLVSPPSSSWGDLITEPGFGPEFESMLADHWFHKGHQMRARLQRYERYGMRPDEARVPTPLEWRERYEQELEEMENDPGTPYYEKLYGIEINGLKTPPLSTSTNSSEAKSSKIASGVVVERGCIVPKENKSR